MAMTRRAVARESAPAAETPNSPQTLSTTDTAVQPTLVPGANANGSLTASLQTIAHYIPTEVLGVYIPLVALVSSSSIRALRWYVFWFFLAATPIVIWLMVADGKRKLGKSPPRHLRQWPWWPMSAATVAFAAYAIALPGSMMHDLSWYEDGLGFMAVLLASFLLLVGGQVDQLVEGAPARRPRRPSRLLNWRGSPSRRVDGVRLTATGSGP
jgi:hypothetical protein